jgi:hypothetical protein
MAALATSARPILRMILRLTIGESVMAGSDDPLFLGLHGAQGREFRVRFARGPSLRRGGEESFCLGSPNDPETNIANPGFNDPTAPALDGALIQSVYLRKGFEPVPNVRGMGEMDDRLELIEAELSIHTSGRANPLRFHRRGPLWLGLVAGLRLDLARVDEEG